MTTISLVWWKKIHEVFQEFGGSFQKNLWQVQKTSTLHISNPSCNTSSPVLLMWTRILIKEICRWNYLRKKFKTCHDGNKRKSHCLVCHLHDFCIIVSNLIKSIFWINHSSFSIRNKISLVKYKMNVGFFYHFVDVIEKNEYELKILIWNKHFSFLINKHFLNKISKHFWIMLKKQLSFIIVTFVKSSNTFLVIAFRVTGIKISVTVPTNR